MGLILLTLTLPALLSGTATFEVRSVLELISPIALSVGVIFPMLICAKLILPSSKESTLFLTMLILEVVSLLALSMKELCVFVTVSVPMEKLLTILTGDLAENFSDLVALTTSFYMKQNVL